MSERTEAYVLETPVSAIQSPVVLAVQALEQSLHDLEKLSPEQALCAKRASLLFETLNELGRLDNLAHSQVDHVKLLKAALRAAQTSEDGSRSRDKVYADIIDYHTLSVLQKAAR